MDNRLYKIEKQDHCIRVQFERGIEISPDIIIEAMDRENKLHRIKGRRDIWDFRGCFPSSNFGFDAMSRVVGHISSNYGGNWSDKTALLVDDAIQYGLSRMFQILVDGYPTQIGIFQIEEDALRWIDQKPNSEGK